MINMQNIGPPLPMIGNPGRPENAELNSGFRGEADRFVDKLQTAARPKESKDLPKVDRPDPEASPPIRPKGSGQKIKANSATQKFMDSMESELGVTPERILAALAVMKPSEISSPAANTADSFVENLSLESFDKSKATQLYNQFLMDKGVLAPLDASAITVTSARPTETLLGGSSMANATVSADQVTDAKGILDGSALEQLSSDQTLGASIGNNAQTVSFEFSELQNSNATPALGVDLTQAKTSPELQKFSSSSLSKTESSEASPSSEAEFISMSDENDSPSEAETFETAEAVDSEASPMPVRHRKNAAPEQTGKTDLPLNSFQRRQKLNESIDRMNDTFFMQSRIQAQTKNQLGTVAPEEMPAEILPFDRTFKVSRDAEGDVQNWKQQEDMRFPGVVAGRPVLPTSQLKGETNNEFESNLEESLDSDTDEFQSQVFGRLNSEWEPSKVNNPTVAPANQTFDMTSADKAKNMQRLIENARVLAQGGGGELRMKLAPEGLGEIQLKVVVANGKVDLEIKSQNHDAKKMLESSLNELKSTLSHHNLTVDKVKVDVGTQDSLSSNDSFLKQFQMNDGQEQARQFLNQFRENNLSQRQNMFDLPGFKNYQPERGEDLKPMSNGPVRPRGYDQNKGQGLNLVA